jgi:phosphate-selective porin OprO/OprP
VVLVGAEAALVLGALSLQGEWAEAGHDGPAGLPDPTFRSFYGFASVFLTGEHRTYRSSTGTFGRVAPRRSLGDGEGAYGALELAARVSRAALDDPREGREAGALTDVTLGVNWHLNPNARVVANVARAAVDDVDGAVYAVVTRFHVDF